MYYGLNVFRTVIVLTLILFQFSYSQSESAEFVLKDGTTFTNKIVNIKSWGLLLDNGESLNFKRILKIKTEDQSIINRIKIELPSLVETIEDGQSILDFSNITYHQANISSNKFVESYAFSGLLATNRSENLEIHLSLQPKFCRYLFTDFAFSFGWYSKKGVVTDIQNFEEISTNYKNKYDLQAFNYGIGFIYPIRNSSFILTFNFAKKQLDVEQKYSNSKESGTINFSNNDEILFLAFNYKYNSKDTNAFWTLGTRYYLNNIKFAGEVDKFSVNIGLGLNF